MEDKTMQRDPRDELMIVADVTRFLSFIVDSAGHHGFVHDLNKQDCKGLSAILEWVSERTTAAEGELSKRLETCANDTLTGVGLPEEALRDPALRKVWRDGFAAGRRHGEGEA